MATRLDRLLVLLDTGSTPVTRKVAAQQLGEVQKLHPHELYNLLHRVHGYLKNTNWDTRIASAQAIEAIIKNVPLWNPVAIKEEVKDEGSEEQGKQEDQTDKCLTFATFNIKNVLQHGESLLGSAGDEFEVDDELFAAGDAKDHIARERLQLKRKLGLNTPWAADFGIDQLVDDEDLIAPQKKKKLTTERHLSLETLGTVSEPGSPNPLSSREKNKAIRRAKKLAKQRSKDQVEQANGDSSLPSAKLQPPQKMVRTTSVVVDQPGTENKVVVDSVADHNSTVNEGEEWPFEYFCSLLCRELFDKAWEVRHGAASGLREIIKIHGSGAAKVKNSSSNQGLRDSKGPASTKKCVSLKKLLSDPSKEASLPQGVDVVLSRALTPFGAHFYRYEHMLIMLMENANQRWLEDVALRLLCVFALDRFGDYISDQVVAPVIETCAQTLGAILRHMTKDSVRSVLAVLLTLLSEKEWQVRHGGLLGLKYMLAVRKDMTNELLPQVLPHICQGFRDGDDDVRAVASSALVPVAEELVMVQPSEIPGLLSILWETLQDLDDLTASTSSVMALLSSLLQHQPKSQRQNDEKAFTLLVPRVWRFLHHNIFSVRSAALKTLDTLLSCSFEGEGKLCLWLQPILRDHLIHLFQRFILESNEVLLQEVHNVWVKSVERSDITCLLTVTHSLASLWCSLMVHPMEVPIDPSMLASDPFAFTCGLSGDKSKGDRMNHSGVFLGGCAAGVNPALREEYAIRARMAAASALGPLLVRLYTESPQDSDALAAIFHGVLQMISSSSATHRFAASLILLAWADTGKITCTETLKKRLHQILSEQIIYDELVPLHHKMQADIQNLIMVFLEEGKDFSMGIQPGCFTVDHAQELAGTSFEKDVPSLSAEGQTNACSKRSCLINTINQLQKEYQKNNTRVLCAVACIIIALKVLPEKLTPVIRPLMDSIKREENKALQFQAARFLARLLILCVERKPSPNVKIIKNLCSFICSDSTVTPKMSDYEGDSPVPYAPQAERTDFGAYKTTRTYGILTLSMKEKETLKNLKRGKLVRASSKSSGPISGARDEVSQSNVGDSKESDDENTKDLVLQRTGGELALCQIAEHSKERLPKYLPALWDVCFNSLRQPLNLSQDADIFTDEFSTPLVTSLRTVEVMAKSLDESLLNQVKDCLPTFVDFLKFPSTIIRHLSARCLGALSKVMTMEVMQAILKDVFPLLGVTDKVIFRQGAIEAVTNVVDSLRIEALPYIVLLIVPVLGRMSDQVPDIRTAASSCFANLIQLIPLEAGIPDPPGLSKKLIEQKKSERRFLEQLLDGSKVDSYKMPVNINAELRKYQQDGVSWLAFLNKYNLHGILCDDMGLGKTLQSLCVIAGDHAQRAKKHKETKSEDCKPLPSLVVCPPTLTGHWCYEVEKFCDKEDLRALHYYGSPGERLRLQSELKKFNLVVASYDIVRNDSDFFQSIHWNYCVLDEGHIIKNSKTKLSIVIKKLKANHRLILSGTPIQNNVLELWALFDFLLPGFLGTEKEFTANYGKPILQSRDAKSSSKEQEAGVLAMEALHRQVLPFVLRRMKEDVLQDLPPKIIQDYYCDLSQIQMKLYEDFAKSKAKKSLVDSLRHTSFEGDAVPQQSTHVFQALQYLRKVCNHPSLVLKPSHPEYQRILDELRDMKSSIHDIQHATKLVALRQLLVDCGIGTAGGTTSNSDVLDTSQVVSQHRALIFCQLRSMLDIIENDLLKSLMPSVTYLRLDGGTPPGSRHQIVQRFNDDPSIDILLLTTHVGGLGLNLTGADTVIFVEHDWNPTKDLQAMDRAHRIGQKKVVNVYRLITRGTLEEKIMGLQKFKLSIANTVITQDNSSLQSMDTNQLLDLFSVHDEKSADKKSDSRGSGKVSMKALLEEVGELWDEKQYENEYDLDSFMKSF